MAPNKNHDSINLPSAYWYEIWSQVIAKAWSALSEVEAVIHKPASEVLSRLASDEGRKEVQDALHKASKSSSGIAQLLFGLPNKKGEVGRTQIDWNFLVHHKFVFGPEPLNFPHLSVEMVGDGEMAPDARYMEKNAFRNINGWAQDLAELGGSATIRVPDPKPIRKEQRALALDWYAKQGFHMPFAPNNRAPFGTNKTIINAGTALGFSGGRIGEESASDALNCDAAWFAVFPQILASAWHDPGHLERLVQKKLKQDLRDSAPPPPPGKEDPHKDARRQIQEHMARERDSLFAQFGYSRPVGLEVDFEVVEAAYSDEDGWDETPLKPTLVVRIPPPPKDIKLHPIALADFRATGKAQLFTT